MDRDGIFLEVCTKDLQYKTTVTLKRSGLKSKTAQPVWHIWPLCEALVEFEAQINIR